MSNKTTRTWTVVLVAVLLALSLLLTACGKSGETPTGDITTPGVTDTKKPETTPDNSTSSPDASVSTETPDVSNPPESSSSEINKAAEYEAGGYHAETKETIDNGLANIPELMKLILGIDDFNLENTLDDIEQKYGKYLNVNITRDAIKIGIFYHGGPYYEPKLGNLTGISPDALKDVNDFLASKGETPLDSTNPEQNIAALWLATSLYYDPTVDNGDPAYDIALPFGLAWADNTIPGSVEEQAEPVWSAYVSLFNLLDLHY